MNVSTGKGGVYLKSPASTKRRTMPGRYRIVCGHGVRIEGSAMATVGSCCCKGDAKRQNRKMARYAYLGVCLAYGWPLKHPLWKNADADIPS